MAYTVTDATIVTLAALSGDEVMLSVRTGPVEGFYTYYHAHLTTEQAQDYRVNTTFSGDLDDATTTREVTIIGPKDET